MDSFQIMEEYPNVIVYIFIFNALFSQIHVYFFPPFSYLLLVVDVRSHGDPHLAMVSSTETREPDTAWPPPPPSPHGPPPL